MAEEIELKLAVPANAFTAVRNHPAVAAVARGRSRTTRLSTTYYDTSKRDLAAAGVALRLRRDGTRWLQTVKGAGDAVAGLHRRAEYEWRLSAPRLDHAKLASTPWRKLFEDNGVYRPVFGTELRRSEQPLTFADGTRATLCFDVGEIRAGRRRAPVSEIEVELQTGDPSRLFELASALAADLPVRIEHDSKAARGYALATRAAPEARRSRAIELSSDSTVPAALVALASDCIAQIEVNAAAMLVHSDREYLHQLRVGWRRLRSLLKLAALTAPRERIDSLEDELRWLGSALGAARDYDVFTRETMMKIAAEFRDEPAIAKLCAQSSIRRRRAMKVAREAAGSSRLQKLLIALGAFFAAMPRPDASETPLLARDWIGPVLEERHDKLRKRAKHLHRLGAAERHKARVAAKRLRYIAEFFASLFAGKRAETYVSALSKLQSALGRLNDLEVAGRLVEEIAPRDGVDAGLAHASGVVRGWLAASKGGELKRLRDIQRAFRRCPVFWKA